MKCRNFQGFLVAVACAGIMMPTALQAETIAGEFTDVALQKGGLLVGQLVDQQGVVQKNARVVVLQEGQQVAQTMTDENGMFAVQGLRGGQYMISSENATSLVRAWAPSTAPPSAPATTRLVQQGHDLVRGQFAGISAMTAATAAAGTAAVVGGAYWVVEEMDDNS